MDAISNIKRLTQMSKETIKKTEDNEIIKVNSGKNASVEIPSLEAIKIDSGKDISVEVPSLESNADIKKQAPKKEQNFVSRQTGISLQQILSLMAKQEEEKLPLKKTEAEIFNEPVKEIREKTENSSGGYGSSSKSYGAAPELSSYADYSKIFSYLGKFRAFSSAYSQSAGEDFSHTPEKAFQLADIVTIETGARYVKYFSRGTDINATMLSAVPIAGMDAAEWAQFKLWVQLDPVMYRLKTTTS